MSSLFKISNKIDNILGSPGQKTTQKQPEMTVSAGTKIFENLKLEDHRSYTLKLARYVYHLNTFHLLKTEGVNQREGRSKKANKKCQEFIKSWL